ncbi:phosphoglycolate phosphatase [Bacillus sp. SA1-12]|uniref:HAD-IA family hydrolase n=1 Tax=Bacillus sp. SA1-12 TaxID=1455638 RepID=UPI000625026C|nr:HAD-IA family hydrolase [Bacillus sp. SA1-12]KKI93913.1 phosphoglycolate phosphatase [Bacillus sp. SA1-12]
MNILWDFDGTLFDTYPAFTEVMYEVLNGEIAQEDILKQLKVSFSHAAKYFRLTNESILEFKEKDKSLSPARKKPFPFVEEVLKYAKINVIMTHKPREEVQFILDYFGWGHYFREIVAGDDGFPRKPDSTAYLYLHEKYSLDIAIGDRLLDIIPAKEAGLYTCLFQNHEKGADFYLDTYEDFFKIVKLNT